VYRKGFNEKIKRFYQNFIKNNNNNEIITFTLLFFADY
jgi:hypothetical protein